MENEISEGIELALRTFHKWRIAVEEMFGLIIECERKGGYHYYIANDVCRKPTYSVFNPLIYKYKVTNFSPNMQVI